MKQESEHILKHALGAHEGGATGPGSHKKFRNCCDPPRTMSQTTYIWADTNDQYNQPKLAISRKGQLHKFYPENLQ